MEKMAFHGRFLFHSHPGTKMWLLWSWKSCPYHSTEFFFLAQNFDVIKLPHFQHLLINQCASEIHFFFRFGERTTKWQDISIIEKMLETNILKMAIYQKCQTALKISDSFFFPVCSRYTFACAMIHLRWHYTRK